MINPVPRLANFGEIRQISEEVSRFVHAQGGCESAAQKLSETPDDLFLQFFVQNRASDNRVFELVDDLRLCSEIANGISDPDKREDFIMFFECLTAWRQLDNKKFSLLRSTFGKELYDEIRSNLHYDVNILVRGTAGISADTVSENIRFRGIFALANANKSLGEDDELIISCELRSYLQSVNSMLHMLTLRPSERRFISESFQQKAAEVLDDGLAKIENTITNIRKRMVVLPSEPSEKESERSEDTA